MPTPLCALALAIPQTDVWVVDQAGGPGSDFLVVDAAIQAASDGDVILVRFGYYDPFSLNGKSLVIVGDEGTRPSFNYTSVVKGLDVDQQVVLSGLQLGPTSVGLHVQGNDGPVWVADCRVEAHDTFATGAPDAMYVSNNARVVVSDTYVAAPDWPHGGDGLVVWGTDLVLWDSELRGGYPGGQPSISGGVGMSQTDGSLFASGVLFRGGTVGDGGDWGPPSCYAGGDGGAGLALEDVAATLRDCVTVGGLPGSALGGTTADLTLEGEPGDAAFAVVGLGLAPFDWPDFAGVVVPGAPFVSVVLGQGF